MKLTVIEHHSEDSEDCGGDYSAITIHTEDGKQVVEFGDHYHDKGEDKADAFIEGVEWATGKKVKRTDKQVADWVY